MTIAKYNRHSIRLKCYDYSSKGAYFLTICTHNRQCLFGQIVNQQIQLNESGNIVRGEWLKTKTIRKNINLDEFIIMPNHLHGIINIVDKTDQTVVSKIERRGVLQYAPTNRFHSPSQTIGSIIRGFKSITTKQINILRKIPNSSIWQRNFYEHIIRTECGLNKIRQYIIDNPKNWDIDKENPNNITTKGKDYVLQTITNL